MSGLDLHEFNILSKKHNYFLTNNRKNGFPGMKENSSFLKKVLNNKGIDPKEQILRFSEYKPKKFGNFNYSKNKNYRSIYQSPMMANSQNNSIENFYNKRFRSNNYSINHNSNNKTGENPYKNDFSKVSLNKQSIDSSNYKIPFKLKNVISISPEICNQYYTASNINDSDNEVMVLSFKGKKIFGTNSFAGFKNDSTFNSPEKNRIRVNTKGSELYRNTEELKRKKEEIYNRKMKRESSKYKKEILRKEKDKELKEEKLNLKIKSANISLNLNNKDKSDNKNKIKITSLYNKDNKINENNNINKRINTHENIKNNSNDITSYKNINKNQNSMINSNKLNNNNIKRINKYRIIKNNIANREKEKNRNNQNNNDSNQINPINKINSVVYTKKNFKTNNIYISKGTIEHSKSKNNINSNSININKKIKENIEYLRKTTNSNSNLNRDNSLNKIFSSFDRHNNPYNFIISKKKFIEDNTCEEPIIYSSDKKVSIKVHTLPNLNEIFLGKKITKEKLKFQRAINIHIENNSKRNLNYLNDKKKYKIAKDKNLSGIREEEEKMKEEQKNILNKEQNDAMKEKSVIQKRQRFLRYKK